MTNRTEITTNADMAAYYANQLRILAAHSESDSEHMLLSEIAEFITYMRGEILELRRK